MNSNKISNSFCFINYKLQSDLRIMSNWITKVIDNADIWCTYMIYILLLIYSCTASLLTSSFELNTTNKITQDSLTPASRCSWIKFSYSLAYHIVRWRHLSHLGTGRREAACSERASQKSTLVQTATFSGSCSDINKVFFCIRFVNCVSSHWTSSTLSH